LLGWNFEGGEAGGGGTEAVSPLSGVWDISGESTGRGVAGLCVD
jgi:hypothetical protein